MARHTPADRVKRSAGVKLLVRAIKLDGIGKPIAYCSVSGNGSTSHRAAARARGVDAVTIDGGPLDGWTVFAPGPRDGDPTAWNVESDAGALIASERTAAGAAAALLDAWLATYGV